MGEIRYCFSQSFVLRKLGKMGRVVSIKGPIYCADLESRQECTCLCGRSLFHIRFSSFRLRTMAAPSAARDGHVIDNDMRRRRPPPSRRQAPHRRFFPFVLLAFVPVAMLPVLRGPCTLLSGLEGNVANASGESWKKEGKKSEKRTFTG